MRCGLSLRTLIIVQNLKTKNMNLQITIMGIIGVVLCAMPFIITNRNRKKKEKQMLKTLKDLAKQKGYEITEFEVCGDYVIGIDLTKNVIFFQLKSKEEVNIQFVDLSTIKKCHVSNISRTSSNDKIIERLELILTPTEKNKPEIIFEFYNVELSYQLSGEFQSIEKWNELVQKQLNKNK